VSSENTTKNEDAAGLTAEVLKVYLPGAGVAPAQLPALVREVRAAFEGRSGGRVAAAAESSGPPAVGEPTKGERAEIPRTAPAVSIGDSIHDDYLISLEDGGRFRSLRRHLMTKYGLSPDDYREKWGLPPDYPMVAPSYSRARSDLAKRIGLGGPRIRAPKMTARAKKKAR
jgi:predicted transcriptional regulator